MAVGLGQRDGHGAFALDGLRGVRHQVFDDAQQRIAVTGDRPDGAELAHQSHPRLGRERRGGLQNDRAEIDQLHAQRLRLAHR